MLPMPTLARRSLLAGGLAAMTVALAPAEAARPRRSFFSRTGKAIGLQLYTLGDELGPNLDAMFTRLAAAGYRDLELPSLLGKTPAELRAAADQHGMAYSSIHLALAGLGAPTGLSLLSEPQRIADALGVLGIHQAIAPILALPADFRPQPGGDVKTAIARSVAAGGEDIWKRTAQQLNERAAALRPFGITVGYHNHNMEFAPVGNTTGWDILAHEADPGLVKFELDLGWVAAAGLDPAAFIARHAGRVLCLHLKDLKASTTTNYALGMDPCEVGSGKQDWIRILRAAERAGVQHYYVEQEPPFAIPRIEAAERSYRFLAGMRA
jgi:sugar phosphate isomerase/epimerase